MKNSSFFSPYCMDSQPSILIVIPVFNRPNDLINLIKSITKLDKNDFKLHVVIVDDHSDPPIVIKDEWKKLSIEIIRNYSQPQGPAICRNMAVQSIRSDYVWFLDSDAEITNPSILKNMIDILLSNPDICATGGIIENIQGRDLILEGKALKNFLFIYDSFPPEQYQSKAVPGISSTNFFIARDRFLSVEGFDEKLKRDEDADLCLRLTKKGYLFYQGAETAVLHRFSPQGRESSFSNYYESRYNFINTLLETRISIIKKHSPFRLLVLPILDFLTSLPLLLHVIKNRNHLERIKLAGQSMPVAEMALCFILLIKKYWVGWKIVLKRDF